jgi:hypothetical protein
MKGQEMEAGTSAVSVDDAAQAADRAMRRFTGLLRAGVDATAPATRDWSVRDVAAHVAGFFPVYVEMVRGRPSPVSKLEGIGEFNAVFLGVDEDNVYTFADIIDRQMAELLDAAERRGGDVPIEWHGGLTLPLSTILALAAGEGYVHGHDVARTGRVRWVIPPEDAAVVFRGALPLFPSIVDGERAGGMTGTVEVRLRGADDGRWQFAFDLGRLRIERADGRRADWVMSCAPAAFVLASYGRLSPLKATLTGQIVGWGRGPLTGLRFGQAFRSF